MLAKPQPPLDPFSPPIPTRRAGGRETAVNLKPGDAMANRDSFAKAVYDHVFQTLVKRINKTVQGLQPAVATSPKAGDDSQLSLRCVGWGSAG